MTNRELKNTIRRIHPSATNIEIEDGYVGFRSWEFSKEPEDQSYEEEEREIELCQRLEAATGMRWGRGDKNYFDAWND